ncbi:hypothetical protein SAMN05421767_10513 [Granulicatella balaenopterae]|uniref:LPXTG-motif cell wall anchor domain-containing protein n=1 Tax=Granulicatella balaenopterae TaxID=137733 RepID=A0A1H9IA30_9LACT|nr:hypothetical protein [Granulicatella balaenopterae]SEQ71382.1 hypothetical protein SAMN05421767_10513 [Granulicatella balaenopterae]
MRKIVSILGVIVLFINGMASKVFADTAPKMNQYSNLTIDMSGLDVESVGKVELYRIANMVKKDNEKIDFEAIDEYKTVYKNLEELTATQQHDYALEIANNKITNPISTSIEVNDKGKYVFLNKNLTPGIYLVTVKNMKNYTIDPFLITLPQYNYSTEKEESYWNYQVVCHPKFVRKSLLQLPKTGLQTEYTSQIGGVLLILMFISLETRKKY